MTEEPGNKGTATLDIVFSSLTQTVVLMEVVMVDHV